ncbi:MAG: glutathione S-transferase family protein [Rhizobiaceae bacterium]
MKLVGNYLSPYVRRVAVSLNLLELPFTLDEIYVFKKPEVVRQFNPVVRIPVLVLDEGSSLVESSAILDEIDQIVGPERALIPPSGNLRRTVMQIISTAIACTEKAQWAFYEGRVRPAEKIHEPWIEHNESQVVGGFGYLNDLAEKCIDSGWIAGTEKISQADVTTVVAFSFADAVRPNLDLSKLYPELSKYAERCEALEEFTKAPLPKQIS